MGAKTLAAIVHPAITLGAVLSFAASAWEVVGKAQRLPTGVLIVEAEEKTRHVGPAFPVAWVLALPIFGGLSSFALARPVVRGWAVLPLICCAVRSALAFALLKVFTFALPRRKVSLHRKEREDYGVHSCQGWKESI